MGSLLPNTKGTQFTVKDAQERAQAGTKSESNWTGQLADEFKRGASELGDRASQFWNGIRSMF